MVLNIFPRRTEPAEPAPAQQRETLPEPSPEALDEPSKRTRRGTRGGRGRSRATTAETPEVEDIETPQAPAAEEPTAEAEEAPTPPEKKPAPRRRTTARKPVEAGSAADKETKAPEAATRPAKAAAEAPGDEESARPARTRARQAKPATDAPAAADGTAAILKALEQQSRQFEQLVKAHEALAKQLSEMPSGSAAPARLPRVGVFVDAANIELACDRLRARFDWGKVLGILTKDRQLVRALAYSPVHDDPNVSMETQRFAEPFLDKGFKVVTKPLKRFSDGTIKANTDIEMALDVVAMLDRLDVVCLVTGDGDFQPLVEHVQRHGVRCEVVAVGSSTAGNLRHAADAYIDLGQRIKEIKA
ncbi:MAG: NYN domain-containing protein [Dehalococcoidia bacterium]|nr:NYN domain-containing protein [Dehalococcoidia bacterium]